MNARLIGAILLIAGSSIGLNASRAQQLEQMPGIKRTDLQRHDISVPGHEAIQTRVDFAPGAAFPMHRHPGEEVIYVIEGSIEYEVEGQPAVTVDAGGVLFVPAMVAHAAKNVGTVTAAEVGTYVVEKGKPLVELVK
ncbi:cupin [Mesorhizobium sp. WSM4312]|uniref:cupin domain-containing protein n=1 Tax=Mesorhizobium sp. WSM4312 TaxID=2029411 RepID=UPI000BB05460|nr:cupin domain-containing protein [Mesorhizobium sp. WSM4312]PBB69265.1 cupin [Mesorhizobium sp. WSM4312]